MGTESDGVGVEEREEKFDGSTKKKKQACGGNCEGKMVFLLHSAILNSTTITPKRVIKQPLILQAKSTKRTEVPKTKKIVQN
jgi:hypothetical protein